MANLYHESLKQSTLYQSATQGGKDVDAFQYDLPRAMPSVYTDHHVKHIVSNLNFASSASVELSSFGILKELYIKWNVTWTNGTATAGKIIVAKNLFSTIVKRVALMNSSREIFQVYGDDILLKTRAIEDKGERAKWLLAGDANLQLYPAAVAAEAVSGQDHLPTKAKTIKQASSTNYTDNKTENNLTFYTKIPFSFFEGGIGQSNEPNKTNLNLRFLETTRLLIETNPAYYVACGGSGTEQPLKDLKIAKCEVYAHYNIPDPADMQLIEAQYSMDQPSSQLNGNTVLTEQGIATGTGETSHTVKVKVYNTNLATGFTVMIHGDRTKAKCQLLAAAVATGTSNGLDQIIVADGFGATGSAAAADTTAQLLNLQHCGKHSILSTGNSRIGDDFCQVTALKVSSSGRVLFEATDYKQLLFCTSNMTNWCDNIGHDQEVNFTMDRNGCSENNIYYIPFSLMKNANQLSSALALKGLSTVDVEITFTCVASTAYTAKVITNYAQITSIETNSGRIIQSTSN